MITVCRSTLASVYHWVDIYSIISVLHAVILQGGHPHGGEES